MAAHAQVLPRICLILAVLCSLHGYRPYMHAVSRKLVSPTSIFSVCLMSSVGRKARAHANRPLLVHPARISIYNSRRFLVSSSCNARPYRCKAHITLSLSAPAFWRTNHTFVTTGIKCNQATYMLHCINIRHSRRTNPPFGTAVSLRN